MTIPEAIETLKGEPGPEFILQGKQAWKACQLGIEALKAWKEMRRSWRRPSSVLLPGETERSENDPR